MFNALMEAKSELKEAIVVTVAINDTLAAVAAVTANSWEAFAFTYAYWAKFIEVWADMLAIVEALEVELAEAEIKKELD